MGIAASIFEKRPSDKTKLLRRRPKVAENKTKVCVGLLEKYGGARDVFVQAAGDFPLTGAPKRKGFPELG